MECTLMSQACDVWCLLHTWTFQLMKNNIQLLDETEQNIVIYQWRADQLFADVAGRGE